MTLWEAVVLFLLLSMLFMVAIDATGRALGFFQPRHIPRCERGPKSAAKQACDVHRGG